MRLVELAGWTLEIPETHAERARGLLGRDGLHPTTALVLPRCRSVHTIGMRFAIDAVLFDRSWNLVGVRELPSWKTTWPRRSVRHIVEVAGGRGDAFSASLDGRRIRDALGIERGRT
jgi:uncharacterized membrane protein (UPF0127 family)